MYFATQALPQSSKIAKDREMAIVAMRGRFRKVTKAMIKLTLANPKG
jgi:hypothetical protein